MIRISTSMIFDQGVRSINSQTASLLDLQQQVATGRRIRTPADDPVNAARALVVSQSVDIVAQFSTNQENVKSALGYEEAQLTGINDLMARLKELTVQSGNTTLTASDRRSIATEIRARFEELQGIANAADGSGQYLFSGYMGTTRPFGASIDEMIRTGNEIVYQGDDGQRRLQVSSTRSLAVSDSGNDVFMRIRNGNGYFSTAYAAANSGSAIIDTGNVTDPVAWNSAANSKNLEVRFWIDTAGVVGAPNQTYYDLVDADPASATFNRSLFTNTASTTGLGGTFTRSYAAGQPILFSGLHAAFGDFGASVTISGAPADGDVFSLSPSGNQSIFRTMANLVDALERTMTGTADTAKYAVDVGKALNNLDRANDNILKVRADIGSRLNEVDSLGGVNAELTLQYQQTLSTLEDLDFAKAVSDLTRKQVDLEAAQKSFLRTSGLSLFNYL